VKRQPLSIYAVLCFTLLDYLRRFPVAGGEETTEDCYGNRHLPLPTAALPRSEEKLRVLEERYRLRQSLHHPKDRGARRDVDLDLRLPGM